MVSKKKSPNPKQELQPQNQRGKWEKERRNPETREENGKKKRNREGEPNGVTTPLPSSKNRDVLYAGGSTASTGEGLRALLCAPTCRMAAQPHDDESQDNVGTGAEISTENDVPAIFFTTAPTACPTVGRPNGRFTKANWRSLRRILRA